MNELAKSNPWLIYCLLLVSIVYLCLYAKVILITLQNFYQREKDEACIGLAVLASPLLLVLPALCN